MEKFLIVRLGAMGDVIHALPAVRALRDTLPGAKIGWVIEKKWAELLCASGTKLHGPVSAQKPLVDRVHLVDTKRWRKHIFAQGTRHEVVGFRRELAEEHYSIAIDLQGALKSAIITRMSGARSRAGYENPRESWATLFYTKKVGIAGNSHVIDQAKELVQIAVAQDSARAKPQSDNTPGLLPTDASAEQWCEAELRTRDLSKFAILNPGAGWGAKQWPAERYGEVAQALAAQGIKSLINVGPGTEETRWGAIVEESSQGAAQVISCSVGELISLTRRACLFVGGDTGPMHLAAILGVPVVAMFGPTDPKRNGPYYSPSIVFRSESSVVSYSHRNERDAGLMSIQVAEVVAAARKLLTETKGSIATGLL